MFKGNEMGDKRIKEVLSMRANQDNHASTTHQNFLIFYIGGAKCIRLGYKFNCVGA